MIDITKKYRTIGGDEVVDLQYIPKNSAGKKVTYPIKGTIIRKGQTGRWGHQKKDYQIWSEDGIVDIVSGKHAEDNLVLDEPKIEKFSNFIKKVT